MMAVEENEYKKNKKNKQGMTDRHTQCKAQPSSRRNRVLLYAAQLVYLMPR